jgi:ATP-dependent Clp protease adaptor protein ClpS
VATAAPTTEERTQTEPDVKQPVPWNVVLIDDDEHSYDYVIMMMQELFAHPVEKAFQIAQTVDGQGRAVCLTTHKEHAELKRDQILAYGKDPFMSVSKGSMTAVIEPAEFGGDDDDEKSKDGGGDRGDTHP